MSTATDFTSTGVKIEGAFENDRNAEGADLFKAILREAYNVTDVIIGHHLIYVKEDKRPDGFTYQVVQEVPSADALIFDHDIARRIWGENNYLHVLAALSQEPIATRDAALRKFYDNRKNGA